MKLRPQLAKDCGMNPPRVVVSPLQWVQEPKFDGWRGMWIRTNDGVRLIGGRNGKEHRPRPEIAERLMKLPVGTILDSEIVSGSSSSDVATSIAGKAPATAMFFDVLQIGEVSLRHAPWTQRREVLEEAFKEIESEYVKLVPYYEPSQKLYDKWIAIGLEGAVLKRKSSKYKEGSRSQDWTKLKPKDADGAEAIVIGYEMGRGKTNGHKVSSLQIRLVKTGKETSVGKSLTVDEAEATLGKMLEVSHHGYTVHGKVRHPVFTRWRPDRDQEGAA